MRVQPFLLFLVFILLTFHGFGQTLFNAAGEQIWISEGAVVTVNGSWVNQGFFSNNGSIAVSGDWRNEGTYNAGTGQVILNGPETQEINHQGQNIADLLLDGAGEKLLMSTLMVVEKLTLQAGILTTKADIPVVLETSAEVSGGSDTSYVNGPMIYHGTGYRYFPVGKNGKFRPLELLDVQGIDPVLQVEVRGPNPAVQAGKSLEQVSPARFWEVVALEGSYEGSWVSLSVGNDEGFSDLNGVVVAGADQREGVYENLGQSGFSGNTSEGKVTSAVATDKPYLALGLTTEFSSRDKVLVPSAFAPDAPDPKNRTLKIYAINIVSGGFVFKIFNRWGLLVYETTSLDEALNTGWNGMNSKTSQPEQFGVYTYFLGGHFDNQQPVEQTGTITLFR